MSRTNIGLRRPHPKPPQADPVRRVVAWRPGTAAGALRATRPVLLLHARAVAQTNALLQAFVLSLHRGNLPHVLSSVALDVPGGDCRPFASHAGRQGAGVRHLPRMALPAHGQGVTDSRKTSPALGEVPLFVR